ncbi:hypothetical protein ACFFX1_49980 [Dactylosporangium sucinum]|uniref:DUF1449 domain-containing protein n=1 Tax=Dactylosporangium sucinum TaxID=1424081 RepID=A0A917UA41_9ACTN|nr:hypothetical protein [Dactylosporangium sucinum]GGM65807.1 hypothetical protein GCM10007977_079250 [Dactylosporangium sucinum]
MGEFLNANLEFPTVLFTFLLVLVIAYWLIVLLGSADTEALDGGAADGFGGFLGSVGLGGVPATVGLSVLVLVAWFVSLAGATVTEGALLRVAVLVVALVVAWLVTRVLVVPLRRLFPATSGDSRTAFVGRTCVIRTGTVTETFGQAEVTAADGSSAIVQVRQTGTDTFTAGSTAVIYEYDQHGEFFWIVPTPGQRELS